MSGIIGDKIVSPGANLKNLAKFEQKYGVFDVVQRAKDGVVVSSILKVTTRFAMKGRPVFPSQVDASRVDWHAADIVGLSDYVDGQYVDVEDARPLAVGPHFSAMCRLFDDSSVRVQLYLDERVSPFPGGGPFPPDLPPYFDRTFAESELTIGGWNVTMTSGPLDFDLMYFR